MHLPLLIAAALAPSVNLNPDGGVFSVTHAGMLRAADGSTQAAELRIACRPVIYFGVTLVVSDASAQKDFDFQDFNGSHAAAEGKPLSHLSWITPQRVSSVSTAATGYFSRQPAFVFNIKQDGAKPGPLATVLGAVGTGGTLEWTQSAFDNPAHALIATFVFDADAAAALANTVASCLPPQ